MSDIQVRGPLYGNTGSPVPFTAVNSGAQRVADAHARYMEPLIRGNAFYLAAAGVTPTAYNGLNSSTPLLALCNPPNSGKNLVLLTVTVSNRVVGTGAGSMNFGFYGGPSTVPSGTVTAPTNLLSLNANGSVAKGYSNTATTGGTSLIFMMAPINYYFGTAVGAFLTPTMVDLAGSIVVVPGNMISFGTITVPSGVGSWDSTITWEEVPALL